MTPRRMVPSAHKPAESPERQEWEHWAKIWKDLDDEQRRKRGLKRIPYVYSRDEVLALNPIRKGQGLDPIPDNGVMP